MRGERVQTATHRSETAISALQTSPVVSALLFSLHTHATHLASQCLYKDLQARVYEVSFSVARSARQRARLLLTCMLVSFVVAVLCCVVLCCVVLLSWSTKSSSTFVPSGYVCCAFVPLSPFLGSDGRSFRPTNNPLL